MPPNTSQYTSNKQSRVISRGLSLSRLAQDQNVSRNGFEEGIAVLIPGLGSEARAALLRKNIHWLHKQHVPFECYVYVYNFSLHLNPSEFQPCELIKHQGHFADHILAFPLNRTRKQWILHWIDSVVPLESLRLDRFLRIMHANRLDHAAPAYSRDRMIGKHPWLMWHNNSFKVGRLTDYAEMQFDIISREQFRCLQSIIDVKINPRGWGVAEMFHQLCGGRVGLLDEMLIGKASDNSDNHSEAPLAFRQLVMFPSSSRGYDFGNDSLSFSGGWSTNHQPEVQCAVVRIVDFEYVNAVKFSIVEIKHNVFVNS